MPRATGDRFTSQTMADCEFCPPDGRRFRTARQCSKCERPLCLVCRPAVPALAFLCPDCGGGQPENALLQPAAVIERLTVAGHTAPFWLTIAREQLVLAQDQDVEELIMPE